MQRPLVLLPLVASFLAPSATAQTGRTMKLMAPVVLGQTASMVIEHPPSIAGHQFAMAMCSPNYPGALPISIPGVAVGVMRLDPLAYGVLGLGVLDASGQSPALTFPVPNDLLLVGASFDVQGADIDGSGLITLTDNDLEVQVAGPPPAGLNMVPIAAGSFQMGSVAVGGDAIPVHTVTITRPFWMGKFEVTQSQYQAVMGSNPSSFQGADRPVETLHWDFASDYCDALSALEAGAGRLPKGYVYRLPTEAEWEYCCRAGTTTEWIFGSNPTCGDANFGMCVGQTSVVGSYAANAWGLHDMHGNVSEFCSDCRHYTYPSGSVSDPLWNPAGCPHPFGWARAMRGGNWFESVDSCRSAARQGIGDAWGPYWGFRVVLAPIIY